MLLGSEGINFKRATQKIAADEAIGSIKRWPMSFNRIFEWPDKAAMALPKRP
jgi:hypothetical protein